MTATIAQIRQGLKARMDTISGLRASAYMTLVPQPPQASVKPAGRGQVADFDGNIQYRFEIWVYVHGGSDATVSQARIDEYIDVTGSKSIAQAVDGDPSLGGVVSYASVTGFDDYVFQVDDGGIKTLAARLNVEIMA